jgi:hypothetical protein
MNEKGYRIVAISETGKSTGLGYIRNVPGMEAHLKALMTKFPFDNRPAFLQIFGQDHYLSSSNLHARTMTYFKCRMKSACKRITQANLLSKEKGSHVFYYRPDPTPEKEEVFDLLRTVFETYPKEPPK